MKSGKDIFSRQKNALPMKETHKNMKLSYKEWEYIFLEKKCATDEGSA
jgi:hypothetical protein